MKILCVLSEHNYGNRARGESYEHYNFIPAFRNLGHEVLFLESWDRSYYRGFGELNRTLLRMVEDQRPDVVFTAQFAYEIWLETWELLRDAGIAATVNWTTDDSWKYRQFSRLLAPAFHAFTTTYPNIYKRYQGDGIPHVVLTQWAARGDTLQPPLPASACSYQVAFVGTAHGTRARLVSSLREHGVEVTCFGYGWPNGPVAAEAIPEIIRNSVVSLNFANSALSWRGLLPQKVNQIKARTFEVPGAGGFLLTEWAEGLERFYRPGLEVAVFRTPDEMINQVLHYLRNPSERDAVAQSGYARTLAEHTYEHRLSKVLDFTLSQRDLYSKRCSHKPSGTIDWERFAQIEARHRMDTTLWAFKRMLTHFCSLGWSTTRGPRAARRVMYELNWRFAGRQVYSSAGWPGRMFYEVQ